MPTKKRATPPPGGWDDTPKPIGARVKLLRGVFAGEEGIVERNQRVTRPGWDEDHHWVRLDSGRMRLFAPRFLALVNAPEPKR